MTIGTKTIGTWNGTFYSRKQWSGIDGRSNPNGSTKENPYTMSAQRHEWRKPTHYRLGEYLWHGVSPNRYQDKFPTYRCQSSDYLPNPSCDGNISVWTANDDLKLLGKLAEKIRQHDFNLGVFMATAPQAYNQAISTVANFGRSLLALKRGDIPEALHYVGLTPGHRKVSEVKRLREKDISSAWLAMQYGWLPTIRDTHEAWVALSKSNVEREQVIVVTHRVKRNYDGSAAPLLYACSNLHIESKRLKYTLKESISAPRALGLTDPLSVAWELLPWSFVIDWFLPIGDYLDALNIIPKLKGSYVQTHRKEKFGAVSHALDPALVMCGVGGHSVHSIELSRTVGTNLSVPLPKVVSLSQGLTSGRIKNAIALVHQKLR